VNGAPQPTVTIEHELPGRLRLRLSHDLEKPGRVRRLVAEHAGVGEAEYTPLSRSMLVRFDAGHISTEEIVIRVAMGLSLENDNAGIRVLTRPPVREMTDSAFWSGIVLLAALTLRLLGQTAGASMLVQRTASVVTAGAALYHGWLDYRNRGNFDPEVLTVTYLLTALLRGNALPAAAFTWISTFGRHLIRLPARGIVVRPARIGRERAHARFEVVVTPDPTPPDKMSFFGFLPSMLLQALTGKAPVQHVSFMEDIRQVARMHDQVLEGVSEFRRGIPLRVRRATDAYME
jgi:hypothetical protein